MPSRTLRSLAVGDCYTEEGQVVGEWIGDGAKLLGLHRCGYETAFGYTVQNSARGDFRLANIPIDLAERLPKRHPQIDVGAHLKQQAGSEILNLTFSSHQLTICGRNLEEIVSALQEFAVDWITSTPGCDFPAKHQCS